MEEDEFFLLPDIPGFVGDGILDLGKVLDELLLMAVVDTELCRGAFGWKEMKTKFVM